MKKLSETEFDIMKVIWDNPAPATTTLIMNVIGKDRAWQVPALITMLNRLIEKGFIYSEKSSKIRNYYPLVKKQDYLEFITKEFMARYHDDSFVNFFATYYDLRMVSDETLYAFVEWVKKHRSQFRRYYPDK